MNWIEFLEKHDRPRGEMDAGMLFGSEAAPEYRLRELIQLSYRLNLLRPETAVINRTKNWFIPFFLVQMVPSLKKVHGFCQDELKNKFHDVEFTDREVPECFDLYFGPSSEFEPQTVGFMSSVNNGGAAVICGMSDRCLWGEFWRLSELGNDREVIFDRSECDSVLAIKAAGKEIADTKYMRFLLDRNDGGFGVIYL